MKVQSFVTLGILYRIQQDAYTRNQADHEATRYLRRLSYDSMNFNTFLTRKRIKRKRPGKDINARDNNIRVEDVLTF